MKVLCTSDWHLDWRTDGHSRWSEVEHAIDHSVAVARDERVSLYVFCGDLTDPDNGGDSWRATAKAIATALVLRSYGISSLWLAGNHDVIEDGFGTTTLTPMRGLAKLPANDAAIYVVETPCVVDHAGKKIVCLPFTPRSHAYDPAKFVRDSVPQNGPPVFVFGHLNLKTAHAGSETSDMPRGREVLWPTAMLAKVLPKGSLCIGGHYHNAQDREGVTIIGSLARLTHGEEANTPSMLLVEAP